MSLTATQVRILEDIHADFDQFLREYRWSDAQAIIDGLWDTFPAEAEVLRREYLKAQSDYQNHPEPKPQYERDYETGVDHDNRVLDSADVW